LPAFRPATKPPETMVRKMKAPSAAVVQDLMCYETLSFDDLGASHGIDLRNYFAYAFERLKPLAKDYLIELDDVGINITQKARLLLRSIAMIFDRYIDLEENDNRFCKAI
jgi:oxygen-independent coproporphyrinogen-3 oxidase